MVFLTTAMNLLLYKKEYFIGKMKNYKVFKEDAAPKTLFGRGLGWYRLE
jgi:hypothetical protein